MISIYEEMLKKATEQQKHGVSFAQTVALVGLLKEELLQEETKSLTLTRKVEELEVKVKQEQSCLSLVQQQLDEEQCEGDLLRSSIVAYKKKNNEMKQEFEEHVALEKNKIELQFHVTQQTVAKEVCDLERMFNRSELKSLMHRADAWKERNALLVGEANAAWKAYNLLLNYV